MKFAGHLRARSMWRLGSVLCCAALAACSGGGGGGGSSVNFSFTQSAGSVAEGAAPLALHVVLHTSLASLPADVHVDVIDALNGTATSGADYTAFAPVTLTFPMGSLDGDSQQVALTAIDDLAVEGADETVRFALMNAVGGAVSGMSTFTATINDVDVATLGFTSPASSTADESSGMRNVAISLHLPPGGVLATVAHVRVSDAGGGSATSGVDYAVIAPTTVSFSAGSPDGASANFQVQVINDAIIEADEFVNLALSQPAASCALGANALHQFTITDDDASGSPALVATEGPSGVENGLAYDALIDLGTQALAAGPTAGTLVRITNAGGSPMNLGAPQLTGSAPNDFSVVVDSAPLSEPPAPGEPGFELAADVAPPWTRMEDPAGPGVRLMISRARVAELRRKTKATIAGFPAPGLGAVTLSLQRRPLPIVAGAVLRVDGVDVPGGLEAAVGDLTIWTGHVLEVPGATVFLAISSQAVHGWIELPTKTDRFVHLFTERAGTADGTPAVCRVARAPELAALGFQDPSFFCGGEREVPGAPQSLELGAPTPPIQPLTAADCKLAIETDYQFFQKFGSTPLATTYVTQLIAAVSGQYLKDVQTTLSIAYLGLYSTPADPWTSQDSGGNSSNVLDEFRTAWTSSGWPVSANLAHFISGANLGGGVAYVNVLCNQSFGFGVSGNISGSINWGAWTGAPGNFTWDFVVVAHEIGHNFGALHTHSYCPPLDMCSTNCSGPPVCSQGTIMSYCHTCGGMDHIDLVFHPVCANFMRQAVNSSCLGLSALAGGDHVEYRVKFDPMTVTGVRDANLEFSHNAPNAIQPFRLKLRGTGN